MSPAFTIPSEKGPITDLGFFVFLDKMKHMLFNQKDDLSVERLKIIQKVFANGPEFDENVLTPSEMETLHGMYVEGRCHFCREKFTWDEQFKIGYILDRKNQQVPIHQRCINKVALDRRIRPKTRSMKKVSAPENP